MMMSWKKFCWCIWLLSSILLGRQLHTVSGQPQQQQLQFLGQQPFRAYASRSSVLGQVLYRLFAVDVHTGSSAGITYGQGGAGASSSNRHFALREETGELELMALFSSLGEHRVTVEARSDSHSPVQAVVVVTVVRESDTAPLFEREPYEFSVPEDQPVRRAFFAVQATPSSPTTSSSYSILSDTSGGAVSVGSSTGLLSLTRPLDREKVPHYNLTLRYASDTGFADTRVALTVLDANDNAPVFSQTFYNVSVLEDSPVSTSVVTISASDPDISNGMIRYSLEGNVTDFALDPVSGLLMVSSSLDYERTTWYHLTVVAMDMVAMDTGPSNSTVTVIINVVNVNDECPRFESDGYVVDVISATPPPLHHLILNVTAFDPDGPVTGGVVTYSLEDDRESLDGSVFSLDAATGAVTLTGNISTRGQYFLNISARDTTCLVPQAFALVEIRVVDINDHSPVFVRPCNAELLENPPQGTLVTTLNATDADLGVGGVISFSLLNTSHFSVDARTGRVMTNQPPASYDREGQREFRVGAVVQDSGGYQDYCLLTVTLVDQNDNPPVFLAARYNVTLSPDTPPLTLVASMVAFDADEGENGLLHYALQDPAVPFNLDNTTADLVTSGPLSASQYVFGVVATDMGMPSLSSTAVVSVAIAMNGTFPVFQHHRYSHTECENIPLNRPINLSINASGSPAPSYRLVNGRGYSFNGEESFQLSGSRIKAGSSSTADFEELDSRKSFAFLVVASDDLTGHSNFAVVEIALTDIDDNPPKVDTSILSFSLPENQPLGTIATQVLGHDADSGDNGEITYSILDSSPFFNISSDGVIRSNSTFDFEAPGPTPILNGRFRVELRNPNPTPTSAELRADCGFEAFPGETASTIVVQWSVVDQNDNPPLFDQATYSVSVSEDQPMLTSVFTFSASDTDAGSNSTRLAYTITAGNDGTFSLQSDRVILVKRLDFETRESYQLSVLVSDGVHSTTDCSQCSTTLQVRVRNVDDEPPIFTSLAYSADVIENVQVGTTVLTVSATDEDTPTLAYQLSGEAEGVFEVSSSGSIVVSGTIDRENYLPEGVISFSVMAVGGGVAVARVSITVLDVNDQTPRFLEIYSGTVLENMALPEGGRGVVVTRVVAEDLDQGRNGTVTYNLTSGTEHGFRIDPNSGIITAHRVYDRELQPLYFLTVAAVDDGSPMPLSSITTVMVAVGDVNDNRPVFPFPYMYARVFEGADVGSPILTIPTSDLDSTPNSVVNFTLISSTHPTQYTLDPVTGVVSVGEGMLDYEIPQHRSAMLVISIRDPQYEGTNRGTLFITLLDRNDNPPRIERLALNREVVFDVSSVLETLPEGSLIATIDATDDDGGLNGELVYSIMSGDDSGDFRISNDGSLISARRLDYERTSRYNLVIAVSDRGSPPLSSTISLNLAVFDANDNAPSFSQDEYSASVMENAQNVGSILRVEASDPDTGPGGVIGSYHILSGNLGTRFSLNSTSGVLSATPNARFDREAIPSYILTLTASDMGASPLTGTTQVRVEVLDENDNQARSGGRLLIFIHSGGGLVRPAPLGQVYFIDPDTSNDFSDCAIQNNNFEDIFQVRSDDCMLSLIQGDPSEGTYSLMVRGRDGPGRMAVDSEVIVVVDHLSNATFPEESLVTVTVNATVTEFYDQGLNVSLPSIFAEELGVGGRSVNVISVQPGYHDPTNTLDMTISVTGTSGRLMDPVDITNQLFLSRNSLFVRQHGVVAIPTDPCVAEPCSNQAECLVRRRVGPTQLAVSSSQYILLAPDVTFDFECQCALGTAGETCEINYDDCYSNPCTHGAQCTDGVQGFLCDCPPGTGGPDCSFNPDECLSSPCQNDARCVNGFGTYICECLPGFYGNECQYSHFRVSTSCDSSPCENGGTCSPGRNSLTCLCPSGYGGPRCEDPIQFQGGCSGNPCHNGSSCTDTDQGARCDCSPGFSGPLCRWPLNSCELEPCENGGTCEEGLYGSYLCTCSEGYVGENCTEVVRACESEPCLNGGRCVDSTLDDNAQGFSCECTRNFTGPTCDVPLLPDDLCTELSPPCPASSSNCTSGGGRVTCSCFSGFHGNDCLESSPPALASPCSSNPCQHGGSCSASTSSPSSYNCQCSHGYTGPDCEVNVDDCVSDPCTNGGACQDGVGGHVCLCSNGITGENCEIFCPEGYEGEFCETRSARSCSAASCENGGTCHETGEGGEGFTCSCPSTHSGPRCQLPVNCATRRCLNGGTCIDSPGGTQCSCPSGFDGPNCELFSATFSGGPAQNSYRAYRPLERLRGGGRIAFEFATRSESGLLLFSTQYQHQGESWDWLAVEVTGGRLRVSVALGSGERGVALSGDSVRVSDGRWHQVALQTSGKMVEVVLDDCHMLGEGLLAFSQCTASGVTPGNSSFLDLGLPLWIGGVPFGFPGSLPPQALPSSVGVSGCIRNVTINQQLLDLEGFIDQRGSERGCGMGERCGVEGVCGGGACVPEFGGFSCICPPRTAGENCERDAVSLMFGGGSYAAYTLNISPSPPSAAAARGSDNNSRRRRQQATPTTLRSTIRDKLSLGFRTESDTGVLFYIGGVASLGEDHSFLRLESGGGISYHLSLGSGVEEQVDTPPEYAVDDTQWHYLEVERVGLDLQLTLDNVTISRRLGGSQLYLDVGYSQFYAGGVPVGVAGAGSNYVGCLEDIRVDDIVLPTSPDSQNRFASVEIQGNSSGIRMGCALRGCLPDPCQGGNCSERGETDFVCSCEDGSRQFSSPCPPSTTQIPYLLVIIVAGILGGLLLFLLAAILFMVCWRRCRVRKYNVHANDLTSSRSEMILARRDCVVISNDAGGGEQDTEMTEEKWQKSIPLPRKVLSGEEGNQASSSDSSQTSILRKPPIIDDEVIANPSARMGGAGATESEIPPPSLVPNGNIPPTVRAQSPIISAFIDKRLETLRQQYPDLDCTRVFADEGECVSSISLNSSCSYQSKGSEYTLERLKRAGPEFQRFVGLLEMLRADEEEEDDVESRMVHTGLTQTQTQTEMGGSQSQSQGGGGLQTSTHKTGFYF